ncbi:TatD family hydrolase [Geothrix sp. 21YS21S-4]|uniref:TatD family hydrolase n=1 Tax=Geothrix sp. 21YS21S-4 TaxID=3068889 RepID=UPI0027BA1492|nr:TatD family hydrolase [Geothrix sp. 21YS21S-4]
MHPLFDAHSHPPVEPTPGGLRVICGTGESDWEAVLRRDPGAIPMLGLHPWRVGEASAGWAERLEALLRAHRAGVGECGLDFARKDVDRAAQEAAFRIQLRLARDLRRPVAIHAVRAWGRLLEVLDEEGVPPAGALVHAYGGSPETARALQARAVFLSFSPDLLKPERATARAAFASVEDRFLLLETDGAGGFPRLIEAAAALRGARAEDLAALTWENGRRCFKEVLA